jgi:hypothetical protein
VAFTSKSESLFMSLSPVPFLLTIVIPAACNIIFEFSPDVRAPSVLITRVGIALSALFFLAGLYLSVRDGRAEGNDRLLLALATLLAGFPAATFLLVYSDRSLQSQ